ncbi:MAG TPA: hypothetical protein VE152_05665 [Acidimicrobiales bacterium]|nr:hypothetical protein [Acidimicrobiales bacterium]
MIRGLTGAVTGNAQAFGFSITVTVTYGILSAARSPSLAETVGFALSAVAAFSLLNLLVSRLVRLDRPIQGTRAVLIGTATDFLAVGAGVAVAIGVRLGVGGWGSWVLAPFGSGLVYVVVQSLELTLGMGATSSEDP